MMKFSLGEGKFLTYNKELGNNKYPTVLFLSGYMSNMSGNKATAIKSHCIVNEIPFLQFGYSGGGESSGDFLDYTITDWKENTLNVIDHLIDGPVILAGSSMGGWLALLATLLRPERIVGILCMAAAPDFTEDLMKKNISDEGKNDIATKGYTILPCEDGDGGFIVTGKLLEDGKNNLILNQDKIDIKVPVRLIHGSEDKEVPYKYSFKISEKLTGNDVVVDILSGSDHRLTKIEDIEFILSKLTDLLKLTVTK